MDKIIPSFDFYSLKKNKFMKMFSYRIYLLSPFRNISIYSHSPYTSSFKELCKEISKIYKKGSLYEFSRGSIFFEFSTFIEDYIRTIVLNYSIKLNIFKNKNSKPFQLFNETFKLYLEYPKKMLITCLVLSPISLRITDIIKVFLISSSTSSSFTLKSLLSSLSLKSLYGILYHGSFYSILLMLSSKLLNDFIDCKLDHYLNQSNNSNNNNNNNKLYKKASNIMVRTLIKSLIASPIYVITSYYPSQVISSLILGDVIHSPVDPISIAIDIYKTKGIKYFYKGLLPQFVFELLYSFQ
ncbi:hypothetical protein RB653_009440 [Dictyostelium firmibasis]|uniref:Uncharacterized protein n=1 Tax=Dictyostelium firmibasis TaxID=79012 RepID=A0AAN7YQ59_9MYCE